MGTAAQRQRLRRARQRDGIRCVSIEIGSNVEQYLVDVGVLQQWSTDDSATVGHAIEKLFELLPEIERAVSP